MGSLRGRQLYEMTLFAGAGGGLLGSRLLGWRTICYVEHDKYRVNVLKARIRDGYLNDAPIWDDVQTFDGHPWVGLVDIVTAGFPCQPFSAAGKRLGEQDERNRWPDTIRIIRIVRPEFVLLENSPRLTSNSYFNTILGDLASSGYSARWDCIPASAIGAYHERDRLWIVAHTNKNGREVMEIQYEQLSGSKAASDTCHDGTSVIVANSTCARDRELSVRPGEPQQATSYVDGFCAEVPDTNSRGLKEQKDKRDSKTPLQGRSDIDRCDPTRYGSITWWDVEPGLGRVADGVAHRVERVAAIGDGQVPAVVRAAWLLLNEWSDECAE